MAATVAVTTTAGAIALAAGGITTAPLLALAAAAGPLATSALSGLGLALGLPPAVASAPFPGLALRRRRLGLGGGTLLETG